MSARDTHRVGGDAECLAAAGCDCGRYSLFRSTSLLLAAALALAGCQQKMADQPSFKPLEPCSFFADGRSARPAVPGTVARGQLRIDRAYFTGRASEAPAAAKAAEPQDTGTNASATTSAAAGAPQATSSATVPSASAQLNPRFAEDAFFTREFPIGVNESVIRHGRDRYMIYCVVCHDALGTGRGKIVERGYTAPPSFHIDRLRNAPVGRFFAVITEGYGSMPMYAAEIPPEDRWAIVAYVRALQMSQHFPVEDLSPEMRRELEEANKNAVSNVSVPSKATEVAR
jgi:mono/diheme cytochrome c family protein